MNSLIASIRTCPPALSLASLASLILLLLKALWLNELPAPFAIAPALGVIMEGLLSATVAAYLFFVISVQLPQVLERQHLGAFIVDRAESVANGVLGLLQMISGSTTGEVLDQQKVDLDLVNELFSRVSPNANAPMLKNWSAPSLSWLAAMAHHDELRAEANDRLLLLGRFLDPELTAFLFAIESAPHSAGMRSVREDILLHGVSVTNQDLTAWASNYYHSYQIARNLRQYCERFKVRYAVPENAA